MSLFRSISYALKLKPFTSITIKIDSLTRHDRPESINDVSEVQELIEIISSHKDGKMEASRAIRKGLKNGRAGTQLRALTILNELIENGGADYCENFVDHRLLNSLKLCVDKPDSNYYVKRKCWSLFKSWSKYKYTDGLTDLAYLYENVDHNDLVSIPINYQIPEEVDKKFCTLVNDDSDSDKSKEQEESSFSLENHRELIKHTIAISVMHSINLMNALKEFNSDNGPTHISEEYIESNKRAAAKKHKKEDAHVKALEQEALTNKNRGEGLNQYDRARALARSYNSEARKKVKKEEAHIDLMKTITHRAKYCRECRGKILGYVVKITYSEWIGPLIYVNELLITALRMYKKIIQPDGAEFNFDEKEIEDVTPSKDEERESPNAGQKIGLVFPTQNETEHQKASQQSGTGQIPRGDENNPFLRFTGISPFVEVGPSFIPFRTRSQLSVSDPFPNTNPFCDNAYPLSNNPFSP